MAGVSDGGKEAMSKELRLALVSTPRSGNAWVSRVVAQAFELDLLRFHNYLEAGPISRSMRATDSLVP